MYKQFVITNGGKDLEIRGWDTDKELMIVITGEEPEDIYLSIDQVNSVVDYLTKKLEDIKPS